MAVRIDEYGHIHMTGDDTPLSGEGGTSQLSSVHARQEYLDVLGHHVAWYEHDSVFWAITLSFAGIISWLAWVIYTSSILPSFMAKNGDFGSDIQNFFADKAPIALAIGAFVGTFKFNATSNIASHNREHHGFDDYFHSILSSLVYTLGAGILWALICIALIVVLALLAMAIVIGGLSGG